VMAGVYGITLSKWSGEVDFAKMLWARIKYVSVRSSIGSAGLARF
jgi:hypothetical protein